jgi:hypothetical protein
MGDYTFFYKASGNDVLRIQVISHGTTWTGHRGEHAFKRMTFGGILKINGISMEIIEQNWRRLVEWDFCCAYSRIELVGIGEVDNRPAYGVRFTPQHGDSFVCFYDRETYLLVRTDQLQRFRMDDQGPERVYAVKSYFRNYRTEGAIKLPAVVAISVDEGELALKLGTVKQGNVISDSVFQ